jgi:predicted nucleic acid-binding protein
MFPRHAQTSADRADHNLGTIPRLRGQRQALSPAFHSSQPRHAQHQALPVLHPCVTFSTWAALPFALTMRQPLRSSASRRAPAARNRRSFAMRFCELTPNTLALRTTRALSNLCSDPSKALHPISRRTSADPLQKRWLENMLLVDAGPLIAALSKDDQHHAACAAEFRKLREAPVTTWPVITEAMYLLGDALGIRGQRALWDLILNDGVRIIETLPCQRAADLMEKYADLPMDLADATLVALAETHGTNRIFTTDYRDFSAYRISGHQRFEIIPARGRKH